MFTPGRQGVPSGEFREGRNSSDRFESEEVTKKKREKEIQSHPLYLKIKKTTRCNYIHD